VYLRTSNTICFVVVVDQQCIQVTGGARHNMIAAVLLLDALFIAASRNHCNVISA